MLATKNANPVIVPTECTSKYQPLDVLRNTVNLSKLYFVFDANAVTNFSEEKQEKETFKSPSRKNIVNWLNPMKLVEPISKMISGKTSQRIFVFGVKCPRNI